MNFSANRRQFLQTTGQLLASSTCLAAAAPLFADDKTESKRPQLKKAVKIGMVQEGKTLLEKFKLVKSLGFDGIELGSPNSYSVDEVLRARDEAELPIHGLVSSTNWRQPLSHPDPDVRAAGVAGMQQGLKDAKAYGATSVLLVVAKVDKTVSYGDAYKRSQTEMRKLIPMAEDLGIDILLENVWNNFHLSPVEMARYVDELDSPNVAVYFDVGNVVRYGWPEHWILALNKRIRKLDIKEYSRKLQNTTGPGSGFKVELGDGDCDWPAVMNALQQIGYNGWGTAEVRGGGRERLKEIAERMDRCFAS